MLLLILSFVGGALTVLAPCILPLLPVIVGGSLSGGKVNKGRALTVVASLGVSVIAFTFILKVSTLFVSVPQYFWTLLSGGIILALGIITLFPSLWEGQFMARMSARWNVILGKGNGRKDFLGDVIIGAALGPVFSTCSPTYFIVLATVLPVRPLVGFVYMLAYATGLCLALFLISIVGQKIMERVGIAADPKGAFKRFLGALFIVIGVSVLFGFDKFIETKVTNSGFFDITRIEQGILMRNERDMDVNVNVGADATSTAPVESSKPVTSAKPVAPVAKTMRTEKEKEALFKRAPELSSIDGYINTDGKPITLAELKGKVVLLDIWTYSCINCQRTLPYINDWYAKYKDQGFVVVGLHTPEFAFEKVQSNVEKAVAKFGIEYPVVMDNDYSTWRALGNQFWPRKYLIDADGFIVYDHIGEGAYDETETAIQKALAERSARMGISAKAMPVTSVPAGAIMVDSGKVRSPETYFGSARNELLANGAPGLAGDQTLVVPASGKILSNALYLGGSWNFAPERAVNTGAASIIFGYEAKSVYITAGSAQGVEVSVYRDDVFVKTVMVKDETLYTLIEGADYGKHILRVEIPKAGLEAFTFTFG
jgi:cytochrome c biogenesis protein CcdA/thiol-disulfide isomerase/thioredoxin